MRTAHSFILNNLRAEIMKLEGFRSQGWANNPELGPLQAAFPSGFPQGALHEFFAAQPESFSASIGFVSGLLSAIHKTGFILWISAARQVFPPALKAFGIDPARIVFVDLPTERHIPWAIEEALKCTGISAVVGQMKSLDFLTSRRFQLAAERSQLSGFLLRTSPITTEPTACVSRWKISAMNSVSMEDESGVLPGLGFPKWNVELMRMRNGNPCTWELQWSQGKFKSVGQHVPVFIKQTNVG